MHHCRNVVWFVGICAWCVAYAVISAVFWLVFALPFLVVLVLDSLVGEPPVENVITLAPPAPPHQPARLPLVSRRAA